MKDQIISQLFVPKGERYVLNPEFSLQVGSEQEGAQLLIQAFEFWKNEKEVFPFKDVCGIPHIYVRYDEGKKGRSQWELARLFNAVLPKFREFGWVEKQTGCTCGCWNFYNVPVDMLRLLAEGGPEAIADMLQQKKEAALLAERQRCEESVSKVLNGAEVSDVIRSQLVNYRAGGGHWEGIKVVSKDLVVSFGPRSESASVAGVGYFDEVRIWYKGQMEHQHWQWRDQYDMHRDRFDLRINGVGEVTVISKEKKVEVKVELVNTNHGNRFTTFVLEDKEEKVVPMLSTEEQVAFEQRFQSEVTRKMSELQTRHTRKSLMLLKDGPGHYRVPKLKSCVLNANLGIGAFITEEQIDHHGSDRQMQFKVYVMGVNDKIAVYAAEDHAYENREGACVVTIVDLTVNKLVINTRNGKQMISLPLTS